MRFMNINIYLFLTEYLNPREKSPIFRHQEF